MKLIGLMGNRKSGKDTFIDMVHKIYPDLIIQRIAFADRLKKICSKLFNIDLVYFIEQELKEKNFTIKIFGFEFKKSKRFSYQTYEKLINILKTEDNIELTAFQKYCLRQYIGRKFSTPRAMLQCIGTDILRDIVNKNFHVNTVKDFIKRHKDFVDFIFVSDVRFLNEADLIKEQNGKIIKILRDTTDIGNHQSDTALLNIPYDAVIDNNGSLNDYLEQIVSLI